MRIAQVAPLFETVPPERYGGTERVVAWLVDELVRQGHEVTLFAAQGSGTLAQRVIDCGPPLTLDFIPAQAMARHLCIAERVVAMQDAFDVVHFHGEILHFPVTRRLSVPHVTTLHNRLDLAGFDELYATYFEAPLVSISDAQRRPVGAATWAGTVHHGLPRDLLRLGPGDGGYVAFLGRMARDKGPHTAIEIARRAGVPLKMAAKVDGTERPFFEAEVVPRLGGNVEYVGQVDDRGKQAFLGHAEALLFPIDWPEPFGLVMIEAMACGTPVIAFPRGSVPEVIEDGVTGFVVSDVDGAVEALREVHRLDRARIRRRFEERFTSERMVQGYLDVYAALGAREAVREMELVGV